MSSNQMANIHLSSHIWNKVLYPLIQKISIIQKLADFISYNIRKRRAKPISKTYCINKEWFTNYNIDYDRFISPKKLWITWIARLKNSADFLELCVESFLPYLDEIILSAEQSTDDTNIICQRLANKYPDKIKYYLYDHKVIFRDYDWELPPTSDSVHSFAYYTNRSFSKATYQYVMRLDDDLLPFPDVWEKMRAYILDKNPQEYLLYSWINILKQWNRVGVMKSLPLCGTWWDNSIYPVNEFCYFSQIPWSTERIHFNLPYKRFWLWFIHLKNLKRWYGTWAYNNSSAGEFYKKFVETSALWEIHEHTNYPPSKIYEILSYHNII